MKAELLSASEEHRAPSAPFRLREFRRVLALAWPHRRKLFAGFLLTLLFASLHTASISGAFPVFKILLDDEGLRGWIDRTLAGERLGAELAPAAADGHAVIVRVRNQGPLYTAGVRDGDHWVGSADRPIPAQFREVVEGSAGDSLSMTIQSGGVVRTVSLQPSDMDGQFRILRWFAAVIPSDDPQTKVATLIRVLVVLVSLAILANVCRYFGEVLIAKAVLLAMLSLREKLYDQVLRLPLSYFAGQPTSDIVTRFVQDIQEVQRGLITLFGKFLREPLRALFLLAAAFAMDWRITLVVTLGAPAAVAVFWWVGRSVKTANKALLRAYGTMIGALTASLQNLRVVKVYTAEDVEASRLDKIDRGVFKQQYRLAKLDAFVSPMMETVAALAGSFITVWLLSKVLNHELSVSKFATLGLTLSVLFDPLRKMSDVWVRIQRSVAGAERIYQVLDHPMEGDNRAGPTGAIEVGALRDAIEYRDVTFTYVGAPRPSLRNVSLIIRRGETVAIVGPNGSGKTTLVSLLPRLFEPDFGSILMDGVDLRRVSLPSLRRQIGLVTQEAVVFGGTPAENIAYGNDTKARKHEGTKGREEAKKQPSDNAAKGRADGNLGDGPGASPPLVPLLLSSGHANEKGLEGEKGLGDEMGLEHAQVPTVVQAEASMESAAPSVNGRLADSARRAFADEFIRHLPGGYSASIGERGGTLSGGQRQRLAIARAVYRDAPILIFDEATSQIDSESEQKIQAAIRDFAKNRTTIIIAHRLSTIQFAERIVVMDAGRIIDQGSHAELVTRCELYKTLCETQLVKEPAP